ncbi:Deubiquitinating protein VCIP135 [Chamberlinius hualienensis]
MPSHDSKFLSAAGRVYSGYCPDVGCQTKLLFPSSELSIECTNCGQRHQRNELKDLQLVTDANVLLHTMNTFLRKQTLKRGVEHVKVLGLSNTHCKLISPILTKYGMEKKTGNAKLLTELNQGETFDCGLLGDRSFRIDPEHVEVVGYGRDISGSCTYLADTLATIMVYNDNEERLIPVHADGDGHCLVHAISRALVGRELFWHPLRTNLLNHFRANRKKYQELLKDFINPSEWAGIIEECNPDFQPADGELLGLRNIHVFGLANVLRRPIILLDSLKGMESSGDYAATFLPALLEPSDCRGKSGELNKPLCIAWSSSARNHYISLVGIKNKPLPFLPRLIIPKTWALPQFYLEKYIDFNINGSCIIGGENCLNDSYILKLVSAMENVFMNQYNVHPALVSDVHYYIYKRTGVVGVKPEEIIENTQRVVAEKRLFICLSCNGLCEQTLVAASFKRGGALYTLGEQKYGKFEANKMYSFPLQGALCIYNPETDELIPTGRETMIEKCSLCPSTRLRLVRGDGSIQYHNGDRTKARSQNNYCKCGYKHYWDGKEYDSLPILIPVVMDWGGKTIKEEVSWFQFESDPLLNSNVYEVAASLVQKHFPGVFGSERLVQKVVDQILEQTKKPEEEVREMAHQDVKSKEEGPSKIILSGIGSIHKEELKMSEVERQVRRRIKENAPIQQRRRSSERSTSSERRDNVTSKCLPVRSMSEYQEKQVPTSARVQTSQGSSYTSTMVRIVSSDGRQLRLSLDSVLTCSQFIERLQNELNLVPGQIKKIMYGFPPKDLLAEVDSELLPFHSGDKVSVDIDSSIDSLKATFSEQVDSQKHYDPLRPTDLLQRLQELHNSNSSDLDAALTSLLLSATLSNQSLWTYMQNMPHLFTANGLLYNLVKRDIGLEDNKHFHLPILPDKLMRYSATNDRLEICLEPLGHFAVEPDVETKAKLQTSSDSHRTTTSYPGVINTLNISNDSVSVEPTLVNKNISKEFNQAAFHGHGYTLRGSSPSKSPEELGVEKTERPQIGLKSVDEQMEMDDLESVIHADQSLPETIRKGPGFSVLNPEVANAYNTRAEALNKLTSHLVDGSYPESKEEELEKYSDGSQDPKTEIQNEQTGESITIKCTSRSL